MFRTTIFFLFLHFYLVGLSQKMDTTIIKVSSSNLSEDIKYSLTKDDKMLLLVYIPNYIVDKDILGIKEFSTPTTLNIKRIDKLDKYEYTISFQ